MKDISSHIMDIVQNSIRAEADFIGISVDVSEKNDYLRIVIVDNGNGMSEDMIEKVTSPFSTTRTTRKVGLGIPLLKVGAENTGGSFSIESAVGDGTTVSAEYVLSNIDRPPLGDLSGVLSTLVICNEKIDFQLSFTFNDNKFSTNTKVFKETLDGIPYTNPDVTNFIMDYINDNYVEVFGGNFE